MVVRAVWHSASCCITLSTQSLVLYSTALNQVSWTNTYCIQLDGASWHRPCYWIHVKCRKPVGHMASLFTGLFFRHLIVNSLLQVLPSLLLSLPGRCWVPGWLGRQPLIHCWCMDVIYWQHSFCVMTKCHHKWHEHHALLSPYLSTE